MVRNSSIGDRGVNLRQEITFNLLSLMSFLFYDGSFFSPWNHRSGVPPKYCSRCAKHYMMHFEADSFFTYDITAMRGERVGQQEKRSYIDAFYNK
ncbi:hypothetical protein Hanom_Chr08g00756571 [Helianthus anomalus]